MKEVFNDVSFLLVGLSSEFDGNTDWALELFWGDLNDRELLLKWQGNNAESLITTTFYQVLQEVA